MKTFSFLIASLGILFALSYYFSFWTAFGIFYMMGMLLVVVVAFNNKSRRQSVQRTGPLRSKFKFPLSQ